MSDFLGWLADVSTMAVPIFGAVLVALIVSGREDRRAQDVEARQLQRQSIIDLQQAWLDLEEAMIRLHHDTDQHYPLKQLHDQTLKQLEDAYDLDSNFLDSDTTNELVEGMYEAQRRITDRESDFELRYVGMQAMVRKVAALESRVADQKVCKDSARMRALVPARYMSLTTRVDETGTRKQLVETMSSITENQYLALLRGCGNALRALEVQPLSWWQQQRLRFQNGTRWLKAKVLRKSGSESGDSVERQAD